MKKHNREIFNKLKKARGLVVEKDKLLHKIYELFTDEELLETKLM